MTLKTICTSFAVSLFAAAAASSEEPMHVYLTWQGDTSTTITVNFQTEDQVANPTVYFDSESQDGRRGAYARQASGSSHQIPGLEDGRFIHTVELTDLDPSTTYYFIAGGKRKDFTTERFFKTIPDGDEPIRFVTGGDMDVGRGAQTLMTLAGQHDPMFVAIGGDIAYVNGEVKAYRKWDRWLRLWDKYLVAPDGRMVPMLIAIGNHETNDLSGTTEKAPFYFGFFAQEGRTNFTRKFGANMAMLALDTGHVVSHASQVSWLDNELASVRGTKHTFALYHIPLYPGHREYEGGGSVQGRKHWAPLFDKHGLTTAFENHDHVLKRTPRIKANRINPEGTLYLGDGCFGKEARTVDAERRWYEEVATPTPHFWVVDTRSDGVTYTAIDSHGNVVDSLTHR